MSYNISNNAQKHNRSTKLLLIFLLLGYISTLSLRNSISTFSTDLQMAEPIFNEDHIFAGTNQVAASVSTEIYLLNYPGQSNSNPDTVGGTREIHVGSVSSTNCFFARSKSIVYDFTVQEFFQYSSSAIVPYTEGPTSTLSSIVCLADSAFCIFGKTISTTYSFVRMMAATPWTRVYRSTVTHKIDWMSYLDGTTFVFGATQTGPTIGLMYLDHS